MSRRSSWWPIVAVPVLGGIIAWLYTTNTAPNLAHQSAVRAPLPKESAFDANHQWYNGVALPAVVKDLPQWQRKTGEHPAIVGIYTNLAAPFPLVQVRAIITDGAMPLIQLNPRGDSLAAIVAGGFDRQLAADAKIIAGLHRRVAVSFAHEMNGPWTHWGCRHVTPAVYKAAFRHVHAKIGSRRVTWVWNPSPGHHRGTCPVAEWYPGSKYVDWVGLDGYLRTTNETFGQNFNATISQIRKLAPGKPMLFAEVGVPVSKAMRRQVRALFAGARKAGMIGLVWFDGKTTLGDYEPFINRTFLRTFRHLISK